MSTPLITVGLTCYNASETIARAIKSAQNQSWENLEILVVDDCSRDNSIPVIEKTMADDTRARLIRHDKNKGPAGARQTIVDNASGRFIAFFDDDDESLPERIAAQYKKIKKFESETGEKLIACYASGVRLYDNGYEKALTAIGSEPLVPHGQDVAAYLLFYRKNPGWFYGSGTPTCALMARTDVFKEVGGFDPSLRRVEDVDFAIRLALSGGLFVGCREKLFVQHATTAKDKSPEKNYEAERALAEKYKPYLQSRKRYFYAKTWPKLRYYHFTRQYGKFIVTLGQLMLRHPVKTAVHLLDTGPKRLRHEQKMEAV